MEVEGLIVRVNSARECSQERGGSMSFDDLAGRRLNDGLLR